MTWSKNVTIWCDGEDCSEFYESAESVVISAEREAGQNGWSSPSNDEHYCPTCVAEGNR